MTLFNWMTSTLVVVSLYLFNEAALAQDQQLDHNHDHVDHNHQHQPQQEPAPSQEPPAPQEPQKPDEKVEELVVTGTMTEKTLEEVPIKTQVIDRTAIERMKATNLADTLELTSGVRIENDCQNCGFTQVRLNGLEGRYTQILIDGKPVFSSLAGVYGLEQIPEEMIERVEIVKGGGSALYGGNAVGGVVNVITARPRYNFARLDFRGGLLDLKEPEFRLGANTGAVNEERTLAVHVFGGASRREPWDANDDGFSEVGKVSQVLAGAESYFDVMDTAELMIKFHVVQESRRGGNDFDKPEHDAGIAESIRTQRVGGEIRFKHIATKHFSYDLGYGLAYTERDSYYGGGGDIVLSDPPTPEEWEQKLAALNAYGHTTNPVHTADGAVNLSFNALGMQIITLGGQFLSDGLDDRAPGYNRQIDELYTSVAGFVQHDWMFAEWGESIVGLRVDKHSELDNPVLNPRAALKLSPLPWLKTRTSFTTGFRAPQVFDEDLHIAVVGGEGQVIYNDPNLDPERSYGFAQQIEGDFDLASNWSLEVSINGFWTRITDAFTLDEQEDSTNPNEMVMLRVNRGDTTVFGAELETELVYDESYGIGAGWTYENAKNTKADPDFNSKEIFRTPETYGFAELRANPGNGFEISTVVNVTGPMTVPHYAGYIAEDRLEKSPWLTDWSANLSYKLDLRDERYLQPYVGIRNILDSRQDDYDIGPDRDAGYIYGPRYPRSIFFGVKGGI